MTQILALSVALLLFGSGIWANLDGGSLSQNRGGLGLTCHSVVTRSGPLNSSPALGGLAHRSARGESVG
jgi:hypothetical protein